MKGAQNHSCRSLIGRDISTHNRMLFNESEYVPSAYILTSCDDWSVKQTEYSTCTIKTDKIPLKREEHAAYVYTYRYICT